MISLNKVFLAGNLTRDPELRYTPGGNPVCSLGLAVSNRYQQNNEWKEDVCFVGITAWGRQAEICSEYLSKGRSVLVEGRLRFHSWETEKGEKRSKLEVVAQRIQFLSKPGEKASSEDVSSFDSGNKNLEEPPF